MSGEWPFKNEIHAHLCCQRPSTIYNKVLNLGSLLEPDVEQSQWTVLF